MGAGLVTDEFKLIHSPLTRHITRDGVTVEVLIYCEERDKGWMLEVVDHLGGATLWHAPFPTDQAALDEAISTIDTEGIGSFAAAGVQTVSDLRN